MPTDTDDLVPIILSLPLRIEPTVDRVVVNILEDALARAKQGEIVSVALVVVMSDDTIACRYHPGGHWAELLAGAECFRARLVAEGT